MLNLHHWKKTIFDNKWILVALLFFVFWKFFLIHTLWDDRLIPPVPDDSYIYILHIDSSLRCDTMLSCPERAYSLDTYAGVDHLTYRVFLGSIGKILHLNALDTYHFGFYIGTILLAITLLFFLTFLHRNNKPLIAFSLGILALYNGSGSYHGFYWVVPSFFALMFFFIILTITLGDTYKHWKWFLLVLIPLAIYTHILGLYFLMILPIFWLYYSYFTKNFQKTILQKILFITIIALASYIPTALYFSHTSYGNPYGPEAIIKNITDENPSMQTTDTTNASPGSFNIEQFGDFFPGLQKIQENYFLWIFPNFLGYIIGITCIGILLYQRKYKVLCLYLAGLSFSLASTLNINGERSLLFLWPMTFLLYGQASWEAFRIIHAKVLHHPSKIFLQILLGIILSCAIILSASYSYLWNYYLNQARNIEMPNAINRYIIENMRFKDTITYSPEIDFLDNKLILDTGKNKPERVSLNNINSAKFYVALDNTTRKSDAVLYESTFRTFLEVLGKTYTPPHETTSPSFTDTDSFMKDHREKHQFGIIEIHTKSTNQ